MDAVLAEIIETEKAEAAQEARSLLTRFKLHVTKLAVRDGAFSHALMSRCFFLLRRAINIAPEDMKYSKEFMGTVRRSLPLVHKLIDAYTLDKQEFPYCIDLHELLMTYVEWECSGFCKEFYKYCDQDHIENRVVVTLQTMLHDPTLVNSADPISNPMNICVLRALFICIKIPLSVRLLDSMIDNIARILSLHLIGIKFFNQQEFNRYRANKNCINPPCNKAVVDFFMRCTLETEKRIYYFESEDDDAEADELQANYELPVDLSQNPPDQEIHEKYGSITDREVRNAIECYRARLCPDRKFNHQEIAKEESDKEKIQQLGKKRTPSPIIIDSDSDDASSFMLQNAPVNQAVNAAEPSVSGTGGKKKNKHKQ